MNALRQIWADGGTVVNGWVSLPCPFGAEMMAHAGFDSLTIDLQHGLHDYASMLGCLQAVRDTPALVRVPCNEPAMVGRALDAGAAGVICPMVNTAAQAAAFVDALRYPPQGTRSNGPIRAGLYTPEYQAGANASVVAMPMIETAEAVANLDAILAVPGVDAIYIGPSDLNISMGGGPILDIEDPDRIALYERIVAAARAQGVRAGIHCIAASYAVRMRSMGFELVTAGSDANALMAGSVAAVAELRG